MKQQSIFEQHHIQAEELFEQATQEEFFDNHLFEPREQDYYLFEPPEHGNAVWLLPSILDKAFKGEL